MTQIRKITQNFQCHTGIPELDYNCEIKKKRKKGTLTFIFASDNQPITVEVTEIEFWKNTSSV